MCDSHRIWPGLSLIDREAGNFVIRKLENGNYQSFTDFGKDKQKKSQKRKLSPKPAIKTEEITEDGSLQRRGRPLSKRKVTIFTLNNA
jgi:hypothetical protein